jgi:hypothetical protein
MHKGGGNIILHKEKGVNPKVALCERCGKDWGLLLLGVYDIQWKCTKCGALHIGGHSEPKECGKCGNVTLINKGPYEGRDIVSGLCKKCEKELQEHHDIVAAGGVYWNCSNCKANGVIKATSPFAKEVRKAHGVTAPKPCGVEFNKENCPACTRKLALPEPEKGT